MSDEKKPLETGLSVAVVDENGYGRVVIICNGEPEYTLSPRFARTVAKWLETAADYVGTRE